MEKIIKTILISHSDSFDKVNSVVTTGPGEYVEARVHVPEWMSEEEADQIQWVARTIKGDRGPDFSRKDLHKGKKTYGPYIRIKMHEIYTGGGVAWLEPVFPGDEPTNKTPNGMFIRSIGDTRIAKVEWREHNKDNNGSIISEKFYGEYVQLHVYTVGLYGHNLYLRLEDFRRGNKKLTFDSDTDETNNDNLATELVTQVKIYKDADKPDTKLQKAIFNIYLEHRWMRLAATRASGYKINIGGKVAAEGLKPFTFEESLLVKKRTVKDTHAKPASKGGNKPVVIGDVVTDVAHFNPCRYEGITKTYPGTEDATLFSTDQGLNVNQRILDIGVVASKDNTKKLTIEVQEADVEHCLRDKHEKETIIDARELQAVYKDAEITEGTKLSFTPVYPYKYIDPEVNYLKFFTTYFPALLPSEADFKILIETCAFDKEIRLSVHPDVAFAMHLQIGRPTDYTGMNKIYYRNISLEEKLVRGIKNEMNWVRGKSKEAEIITKHLPNSILISIIQEIIYDYVENSAEDLAVGLHGYHSFTASNKATLVDYSKKYEWIPKTIIIGGVVVTAAVDALILYLTRGRSATLQGASLAAKAKKAYTAYRKYKRYRNTANKIMTGQFVDHAKPNGVETEFIWPQISCMRGIGYVDQENGRVAVELIERVDASPLFALDHKITGSLGSLVAGFVGITKIFDTAEQAVGVVGMLRDLKSIKKDIESVTKKDTSDTSQSASSSSGLSTSDIIKEESKEKFNPLKYGRFRDIQKFLDALEKKVHKKIDDEFKKLFGTEAKVEADFIGFYSVNYEFRINVLKKMMYLDIFEENGKSFQFSDQQQLTFGRDYGVALVIKFTANADAEQKWSKLNDYVPEFLGLKFRDTKVESEVKGQVNGSLVFERTFTWGLTTQQPKVRDTLIFTGIAGSLYMTIKADVKDDNYEWETKATVKVGTENMDCPDEKVPVNVELIPGFTINFAEQPIFEKSMWEYSIL